MASPSARRPPSPILSLDKIGGRFRASNPFGLLDTAGSSLDHRHLAGPDGPEDLSGSEISDVLSQEREEQESLFAKGRRNALGKEQLLPRDVMIEHAKFYRDVRKIWWAKGGWTAAQKERVQAYNKQVARSGKARTRGGEDGESVSHAQKIFHGERINEFIRLATKGIALVNDQDNVSTKQLQEMADNISHECMLLHQQLRQTGTPYQLLYPQWVVLSFFKLQSYSSRETPKVYSDISHATLSQQQKLVQGWGLLDEYISKIAKQDKRASEVLHKYETWADGLKQTNRNLLVDENSYLLSHDDLGALGQSALQAKSATQAKKIISKSGLVTQAKALGEFSGYKFKGAISHAKISDDARQQLMEAVLRDREGERDGMDTDMEYRVDDQESIGEDENAGEQASAVEAEERSTRLRGHVHAERIDGVQLSPRQTNSGAIGGVVYDDTGATPAQIEGRRTPLGLIEGVRKIGTGFRIILNVGIEQRPFYTVVQGSYLGRNRRALGSEDLSLPQPKLKDREQDHIQRFTHVVTVDVDPGDREPPTYVLVQYWNDGRNPFRNRLPLEEWLTRSQVIQMCGLHIDAQLRLVVRKQNKNLRTFRTLVGQKRNPITGETMRGAAYRRFRDANPWLYNGMKEDIDRVRWEKRGRVVDVDSSDSDSTFIASDGDLHSDDGHSGDDDDDDSLDDDDDDDDDEDDVIRPKAIKTSKRSNQPAKVTAKRVEHLSMDKDYPSSDSADRDSADERPSGRRRGRRSEAANGSDSNHRVGISKYTKGREQARRRSQAPDSDDDRGTILGNKSTKLEKQDFRDKARKANDRQTTQMRSKVNKDNGKRAKRDEEEGRRARKTAKSRIVEQVEDHPSSPRRRRSKDRRTRGLHV